MAPGWFAKGRGAKKAPVTASLVASVAIHTARLPLMALRMAIFSFSAANLAECRFSQPGRSSSLVSDGLSRRSSGLTHNHLWNIREQWLSANLESGINTND